jgi:hypothetical protein
LESAHSTINFAQIREKWQGGRMPNVFMVEELSGRSAKWSHQQTHTMKNLLFMLISAMVGLVGAPRLAGALIAQTAPTTDTVGGAGKPLQMSFTMPHFVGYRFALFNYATKTAGGFADFDYFHVGNVISEK